MSRSMLYTVNDTAQDVAENGTINLGTVVRRFGCNLAMSGNAILAEGNGYYDVDASITLTAPEAGTLTVSLRNNGVDVPGATATVDVTANGTFAIPIVGVIRSCCCETPSLAFVLTGAAATVENIAVKTVKM